MRLRVGRWMLAATVGSVTACGLLSGADDLRVDACLNGACSDARTDGTSPFPLPDVVTRDRVTLPPPVIDAGPPPSYCSGLMAVVSFDSTGLQIHEGGAPSDANAVDLDPGKYRQSFDLGTQSGVEWPIGPGGIPLSTAEGTIAFWFQPDFAWNCPVEKVIVQVVPAGPAFVCAPSPGVKMVGTQPEIEATVGDSGIPRTGAYQHLAATWKTTPLAGRPSLAFSATGVIAPLTVTASTTTPFLFQQVPQTLRVSEPGQGAIGHIDDLGVWSRELSPMELAAVAASRDPLVTACRLQ